MTEPFSEKYLKKLFGNGTDIEDALKRLDILTQQETQMSAAQVLRATHAVDYAGRVRGVADIALGVSDQVQEARGAIQQSADGVDRIECLWFPTAFVLDMQAQSS